MKTILTSLILILFAHSSFAWQDRLVDEPALEDYGYGYETARITYADRNLKIIREGDDEVPVINYPITYGDVLESTIGNYTEIEFVDGTLVQVDGSSRVEFQAISQILNDEALTVLNLYDGAVLFHITDSRIDIGRRVFRVDTQSGSAYFDHPGVYYVEYQVRHMKLKVYRGLAELAGEEHSTLLRSGEYASITGMNRPSRVRSFNAFQGSRFEKWAYARGPRVSSASSSYVDSNLSYYASDLDDNGNWRYEPDIDVHVWVPSVGVSWSPYYNGYWTSCAGALTWVSYDSFGWVTHHYGSWGWSSRWGWYWIPGRYYSPAWVAWSSYDSYLGWCPLGYWRTPYYYDRHRNYNTIVINNNYTWNYIDVNHIHNRTINIRRDNRHTVVRDVTTRPIYTDRTSFRQPRTITAAVRDVEVNRRRAVSRNETTRVVRSSNPEIVSRSQSQERVTRSTGTRAVSRIDTSTRPTSRTYSSDTKETIRQSTPTRTTSPRETTRTHESTQRAEPRTTTQQPTTRQVDQATPRQVEKPRTTAQPTPQPRTETKPQRTTQPRTTTKPRTTSEPKPTRTQPKPQEDDDRQSSRNMSRTQQVSPQARPVERSQTRIDGRTQPRPTTRQETVQSRPTSRQSDQPSYRQESRPVTRQETVRARPSERQASQPTYRQESRPSRSQESTRPRPVERPRPTTQPTARPKQETKVQRQSAPASRKTQTTRSTTVRKPTRTKPVDD
ncbi:MAG: hypothetical protein KDC35_18780 [Acidobacteria bacterium]|nr:hypothetical protein [Acidobacteriota bacterium]